MLTQRAADAEIAAKQVMANGLPRANGNGGASALPEV